PCPHHCFLPRTRRHPSYTLIPYTTLFRSHHGIGDPCRDEGAEAEDGRKAISAEMRVKAVEQRDHGQRRGRRVPGRSLRRIGLVRSEEHTSELQSPYELVCRLLLEKKNRTQ